MNEREEAAFTQIEYLKRSTYLAFIKWSKCHSKCGKLCLCKEIRIFSTIFGLFLHNEKSNGKFVISLR